MKIHTVISASIAMLLSGCASYSNTYRQDVAYADDGSYQSSDAYPRDDGDYDQPYYNDDDYADSGAIDYDIGGYYGGGYYGGYYGGGYGDPYAFGGNYGYCSPWSAFCPGDPLSVFMFPIGGGRYWLMFDGYSDRSFYGYGWGYGYGWPWWGLRHDDRDDDHDHHHHHHHHDTPDPVVVTPPDGAPRPKGGRLFFNPDPRKGIFRPNSIPATGPQPPADTGIGDNDGNFDSRPRDRQRDDSGNRPPMRWRPRQDMATGPSDGTPEMGTVPDMVPRQARLAPSDQPRVYSPQPGRQSRPEPSPPPTWSSRSATPEPEPADVPNQDSSNDRPARFHRRGDGSGGG